MPLATVCEVVPVIVVGTPKLPQPPPLNVAVWIVSVELARPEAVAVCVSVKSVRLLIASVVPLFR